MMLIAITLIWIIYACLDGCVQAHYYDLFPSEKKHPNIHWAYMIQRLVVLAGVYGTLDGRIPVWDNIIFIFCLIFIFSFFHNGTYYTTRHALNKNIYSKRWWSNSETSQAVFEFSAKFRTAMAVIAILFLTGLILNT